MKILVFGHSSISGGAEKALRHLIDLIRDKHTVHVVLPDANGEEAKHYQALGVPLFELPIPLTLPAFHAALVDFSRIDWSVVLDPLSIEKYDLCISNTIAILHGNLLSYLMQIPHVTYVHEFLDDPELVPDSVSAQFYLSLVEKGSVGLLGCSNIALSQFNKRQSEALRLKLPPFNFSDKSIRRAIPNSNVKVLQVIGNLSYRKNVVFATVVAKALEVRGINVRVDFIGYHNNASQKLQQNLNKRQINHRFISHLADPYSLNINSQVVTLVCSKTEPFGLTIAESLRYGIPVVSSKSGGPNELLPDSMLYNVDDVDACVRILIKIWENYEKATHQAIKHYDHIQEVELSAHTNNALSNFIEECKQGSVSQKSELMELVMLVQRVNHIPINVQTIAENIASVSNGVDLPATAEGVLDKIVEEKRFPGRAVCSDIEKFDVVPFSMSHQMDQLYKHGLGMAIELAATFDSIDRVQMAAFIASRLYECSKGSSEAFNILALGDGAGIDSIRLAHAGFLVDYMDYDSSNMTKIAAKNFENFRLLNKGTNNLNIVHDNDVLYNAIVCLEVIEHVANIEPFIDYIAKKLKPGGLLFISECFNGIENRWPTHIYSNEANSGLLPFIMSSQFELISLNRLPLAKPYLFKLREFSDGDASMKLLKNQEILRDLIRHQLNIGL